MDRLYLLTPSSLLSFFKGKKGKRIEVISNVITKGRVGTWATRDHSQKVPFKSLNCKIMIEMINYCSTWSNPSPICQNIYAIMHFLLASWYTRDRRSLSALQCPAIQNVHHWMKIVVSI